MLIPTYHKGAQILSVSLKVGTVFVDIPWELDPLSIREKLDF